ncbi:FkbM family methyltransferase [uncultured Thioclava sp.]|uniref:FkbM family methyltransferase n=1 Tax=uncultured Thioclava sp. TaxID=473858 RepID=UPI0025E1585C|nr:FkbM family methyltransferase [uncultured Thioclava sp.]
MNKTHINPHWRAETKRLGLSEPGFPIVLPTFYGQCAEDYLSLCFLRALATREGLDLKQEKYVECGAYHPVAGSATYLLHRGLGMTGVLVEGNPSLLPELARHRPHDRLLNFCITPEPQEFTTLHIAPQGELSSISPGFFGQFTGKPDEVELETITVPAVTLSTLMATEFSKAPLMLSLDLEGIDLTVIESYDFAKRPFLIQIEASEDHDRTAFRSIERCLTGHDYLIIARTDVNQLAVDTRRLARAGLGSSLAFGTTGLDHLLDHVDVLTLDVFDTILARRVVEPTDVFRWLETAEGWKGFSKARIEAEAKARAQHAARGSEVSLEEIYGVLVESFALPENAMSKELNAENRFLYPNATIAALISRARLAGRRVVAISDIYLSSAQVDGLLQVAGVTVDKVYTSSDHRAANIGKYNGKLFSYALDAEGVQPDRVLHVGDNLSSDVANGKAAGICAIETQQLHRLHSKNDVNAAALRPFAETLAGSVVLGQYTQWLAEPNASRSMIETFGYAYGGPLLVGFAQYLVSQAKAGGIQRLLLLERDGIIVAEALKVLGNTDIEYRTIPASRRMTVFPTLDGNDLDSLDSLFAGQGLITERAFFEILGLTPTDHAADNKKLLPYSKHLERHETYLRVAAAKEKAVILEYFAEEQEMIATGQKVAWVDVGWALSSIKALNEILGSDIPAFCIGTHNRVSDQIRHDGYLFACGQPEDISTAIMSGVELVELIFSSVTNSTVYLNKIDGKIVPVGKKKGINERIRDGYLTELRKGALAFVEAARDLMPGIEQEDLRQHNQAAFSSLCEAPFVQQYNVLGQIPHDRVVGGVVWDTIGDYWKPAKYRDGSQLNQPGPHKLLKDLFVYRVLRFLSKLSPPLPSKTTQRFARSAAKRKPRR